MEQSGRLKPATKHVIRFAAAPACPKMAPTFSIGQTLNNVSALSTALRGTYTRRHLVADDRSNRRHLATVLVDMWSKADGLADSPGTRHVVETRDNANVITWSPRDILRQF